MPLVCCLLSCIHYFSFDFLRDECQPESLQRRLPLHLAHKAIPVWDKATGQTVKPPTPNGVKLETFIFDVFPLAKRSFGVFEVQRCEEFAPIKNASGADSPATAVKLITNAHRRWVEAAGGTVNGGDDIEVSPLLSYGGEGLETVVQGKVFQAPFVLQSTTHAEEEVAIGSRLERGNAGCNR